MSPATLYSLGSKHNAIFQFFSVVLKIRNMGMKEFFYPYFKVSWNFVLFRLVLKAESNKDVASLAVLHHISIY